MEKVDNELLFFIQNHISAGTTRDDITQLLISVGWKGEVVRAGFVAFDNHKEYVPSSSKHHDPVVWGILLSVLLTAGLFSINYIENSEHRNNYGENDAKIKQTISNIRSQAELAYNKNNFEYHAVCGTNGIAQDSAVIKLIDAAESSNPIKEKSVCNSSAREYAVSSRLSATTPKYWCVDSAGSSKLVIRQLHDNEFRCPPSPEVKADNLK